MSRFCLFLAAASALLVSACTDGPAPTDAGELLDAPLLADADAPAPTDVPGADAPRIDGGLDAPDVPFDAGPDVTAEVGAALDLICGVRAYANCTAPWTCDCETFGEPPPFDLDACISRERSGCEFEHRDRLTAFFRRVGVTVDRDALAACIEASRRTFDLCLPRPALESDLPGACWDAFVLGAPLGAACDYSDMRCADGAGVCAGRTCAAAPDGAGSRCVGTCAGDLACVDGTCGEPVAVGGACNDHEDCAGSEPCAGGTCGAPASAGMTCEGPDRCTTGLPCVAGTCGSAGTDACMLGAVGECGSGQECRSSFRRICRPRSGSGATCTSDEECSLALHCDLSESFPGTCGRLPRAGEPCSSRCETGLVCLGDFGPATCQPQRRLGEPCTGVFVRDGSVCEPGLGCAMGFCAALPRLDEPCTDEGLCESGLYCDFSTFPSACRPTLPEGGDCSLTGGGCAEGLYCDFDTFPSTCRRPPGEGAECTGICASGLECRYFEPLDRSLCVPPAGVGEPCESLCDGDAFCAEDPDAGECTALVCDYVFGGGIRPPEPFPFDTTD